MVLFWCLAIFRMASLILHCHHLTDATITVIDQCPLNIVVRYVFEKPTTIFAKRHFGISKFIFQVHKVSLTHIKISKRDLLSVCRRSICSCLFLFREMGSEESESRCPSVILVRATHHQIHTNTPFQAGQVLLSPVSVSILRTAQQSMESGLCADMR
jgi:hypothetical protein